MVTKVSNLVLSILVSSCVVTSIREFNRFKNFWLVAAMTFLSDRAFFRASSASLVQIIWMPNNPTCSQTKQTSTYPMPLKQLILSRAKLCKEPQKVGAKAAERLSSSAIVCQSLGCPGFQVLVIQHFKTVYIPAMRIGPERS